MSVLRFGVRYDNESTSNTNVEECGNCDLLGIVSQITSTIYKVNPDNELLCMLH